MRTFAVHMGSSFQTGDRIQAPCIGSAESYPQTTREAPPFLPSLKLSLSLLPTPAPHDPNPLLWLATLQNKLSLSTNYVISVSGLDPEPDPL